jgi:hypothetical protein
MKLKFQHSIKYVLQRLFVAALVFSVLVPLSACCNCTECPKNLLVEEDDSPCCPCSHQAEKNPLEHQHQSGSVPCECACVKPAVPFVQNNTQVIDLQLFAVSAPVYFTLPIGTILCADNTAASLPAPDTVILFQHFLI